MLLEHVFGELRYHAEAPNVSSSHDKRSADK
jgi:hypothetical protein